MSVKVHVYRTKEKMKEEKNEGKCGRKNRKSRERGTEEERERQRETNQNECCGFRGESDSQQLGDVGMTDFATELGESTAKRNLLPMYYIVLHVSSATQPLLLLLLYW